MSKVSWADVSKMKWTDVFQVDCWSKLNLGEYWPNYALRKPVSVWDISWKVIRYIKNISTFELVMISS